jgi:hypothetical protein
LLSLFFSFFVSLKILYCQKFDIFALPNISLS